VLSGCNSFVEIERYGKKKLEFFRQFLELPNGIPSHDTLSRVFAALKPEVFQACLIAWLDEFRQAGERDIIPIDGKTLRRTFQAGKSALHSVSAWSTRHHLTLGQVAVAAKSNEIAAIPKLLELLDVQGAIVTIDAAGCQKNIAAQIVNAGGDYILALKGNHEHLYQNVQEVFTKHLESGRAEQGAGYCRIANRSHGRGEVRHCYALEAPQTLRGRTDWAGLLTIVMVVGIRTIAGVETADVRYYLSSLPAKARQLVEAIRAHWGIENGLHWVLDIAFDEDHCRVRKDHGPENLAMLNRLAISLLKQDKQNKVGIACKRKMCGWHDPYLLDILTGALSQTPEN